MVARDAQGRVVGSSMTINRGIATSTPISKIQKDTPVAPVTLGNVQTPNDDLGGVKQYGASGTFQTWTTGKETIPVKQTGGTSTTTTYAVKEQQRLQNIATSQNIGSSNVYRSVGGTTRSKVTDLGRDLQRKVETGELTLEPTQQMKQQQAQYGTESMESIQRNLKSRGLTKQELREMSESLQRKESLVGYTAQGTRVVKKEAVNVDGAFVGYGSREAYAQERERIKEEYPSEQPEFIWWGQPKKVVPSEKGISDIYAAETRVKAAEKPVRKAVMEKYQPQFEQTKAYWQKQIDEKKKLAETITGYEIVGVSGKGSVTYKPKTAITEEEYYKFAELYSQQNMNEQEVIAKQASTEFQQTMSSKTAEMPLDIEYTPYLSSEWGRRVEKPASGFLKTTGEIAGKIIPEWIPRKTPAMMAQEQITEAMRPSVESALLKTRGVKFQAASKDAMALVGSIARNPMEPVKIYGAVKEFVAKGGSFKQEYDVYKDIVFPTQEFGRGLDTGLAKGIQEQPVKTGAVLAVSILAPTIGKGFGVAGSALSATGKYGAGAVTAGRFLSTGLKIGGASLYGASIATNLGRGSMYERGRFLGTTISTEFAPAMAGTYLGNKALSAMVNLYRKPRLVGVGKGKDVIRLQEAERDYWSEIESEYGKTISGRQPLESRKYMPTGRSATETTLIYRSGKKTYFADVTGKEKFMYKDLEGNLVKAKGVYDVKFKFPKSVQSKYNTAKIISNEARRLNVAGESVREGTLVAISKTKGDDEWLLISGDYTGKVSMIGENAYTGATLVKMGKPYFGKLKAVELSAGKRPTQYIEIFGKIKKTGDFSVSQNLVSTEQRESSLAGIKFNVKRGITESTKTTEFQTKSSLIVRTPSQKSIQSVGKYLALNKKGSVVGSAYDVMPDITIGTRPNLLSMPKLQSISTPKVTGVVGQLLTGAIPKYASSVSPLGIAGALGFQKLALQPKTVSFQRSGLVLKTLSPQGVKVDSIVKPNVLTVTQTQPISQPRVIQNLVNNVTNTSTVITPASPTIPSMPPIVPMIALGGGLGEEKKAKFGELGGKGTEYSPDIVAVAFGQYGKVNKKARFTGLERRVIPKEYKRKKKKKKLPFL